jgi:hypothetical protein
LRGRGYVDDVRVMRCQAPICGDNWFRLGAEFLWTSHPDEHSLRRLVASLQPAALSGIRFDTDRRV